MIELERIKNSLNIIGENMFKDQPEEVFNDALKEAIQALEQAKHIITGYDKYFTKHFKDQSYDGYNPQQEWLQRYFPTQEKV